MEEERFNYTYNADQYLFTNFSSSSYLVVTFHTLGKGVRVTSL